MRKKLLLVVDVQNDYFQGGKMPLPRMEQAVTKIGELLRFFREQALPVVHVQHVQQDANAPFFVAETDGVKINSGAAPADGEAVITKNRPNSFQNTNLQKILTDFAAENIVICGAMSNLCIDATTRAAVDLGFSCTVIHDACVASSAQFAGTEVGADDVHAAYMANLAAAYASIMAAEDFIKNYE